MSKAEGHASIATRATFLFIHHCSSNNSRGHSLFPGAIIPRGKTIIRGRRLFQILLTGSRALNILFYYPIKSKKYHVKYNYTEHGHEHFLQSGAIIRGTNLCYTETNPRLPRLFSRRRNNSALIDRPLNPTSMRVLYSFFSLFSSADRSIATYAFQSTFSK